MPDSEEISRAFYARLGAEGLAGRTRPEWDAQIVAALVELLPAGARVLDAGCGYGRVALPLARAGYDVEGLDHSEALLAAARHAADAAHLRARFALGSLTRLPYASGSFDVAICLWSSFHELLEPEAQMQVIRELVASIERERLRADRGSALRGSERGGDRHGSAARAGESHRVGHRRGSAQSAFRA